MYYYIKHIHRHSGREIRVECTQDVNMDSNVAFSYKKSTLYIMITMISYCCNDIHEHVTVSSRIWYTWS